MITALHPHVYPELFVSHTLGDQISPGRVTFSGHDCKEKWDIQEAKGTTGALTVHGGRLVPQFTATYYLADDDDDADGESVYSRWARFRTLLDSCVSGKANALPIFHPDLAANFITEVSVASVGGLVWDDRGGATVTVGYLGFKPPKPKAAAKASAKPTGTTPGKAAKPDPNAAAKAELAALVSEAKKP